MQYNIMVMLHRYRKEIDRIMDLFNKKKLADLEAERKQQKENEESLKRKTESQKREIERLEQINDYLKKENEKMVAWVKDILDSFGTREVYNNSPFKIPVRKMFSHSYDPESLTSCNKKTIIIPELIIEDITYTRER